MIVYRITLVIACLALFLIIVGLPIGALVKREKKKKAFEDVKEGDKFVMRDDINNPYEESKRFVTIKSKSVGINGKGMWVLYEYKRGGENVMDWDSFIIIYTKCC